MSKCDDCMYFEYDAEFGYSVCQQDLDEDEIRLTTARITAAAMNTALSAIRIKAKYDKSAS